MATTASSGDFSSSMASSSVSMPRRTASESRMSVNDRSQACVSSGPSSTSTGASDSSVMSKPPATRLDRTVSAFATLDDVSLEPVGGGTGDQPFVSIQSAVEIAWSTRVNRTYQVQWSGDLGTTWRSLGLQTGDRVLVFAPDSVHPHVETGHELYLQAVARSLPVIREASKATGPHKLGAPLIASNYEHAKLLPISYGG